MKTNPRFIRFAAVFLLAALALFCVSCRHPCSSDGAERMIRYLTDELNLTEAQQAMLVAFKDEMEQRRAVREEKRKSLRPILMAEFQKDTIDQERLLELYRDSKPRMDEFAEFIVARLAEFHGSLSPEQKSKLTEKMQNINKWRTYFVD